MVKDPVCGMDVHPERSAYRFSFDATDYHFCSARCLDRFSAAPDLYLNEKQPAAQDTAAPDAVYTCPMHPEIEQIGPGSCPICGMALEPRTSAMGDEEANPELEDMSLFGFTEEINRSFTMAEEAREAGDEQEEDAAAE